jgi:phage gp46-like protein
MQYWRGDKRIPIWIHGQMRPIIFSEVAMDVGISWDNLQGQGDWNFASGDLFTTSGIGDLETAVATSLFTDKRCPDSYQPLDKDRKGWWGDTFQITPVGSHLWLLERGIKSGETQLLLQARDYANEALQWMIDDGIVDSVSVRTYWLARTAIGIDVTLTEPQQIAGKVFRFSWCWSSGTPISISP